MAKAKKPVTAKRQVFLDALRIIKKYERPDGCNFLEAAEELLPLLENAPRSGWLAEEWAICSALWASEIPVETPDVEHIHEHCKGGELFLVAYRLGVLSTLRKKRTSE
jgi:hypothetical protein